MCIAARRPSVLARTAEFHITPWITFWSFDFSLSWLNFGATDTRTILARSLLLQVSSSLEINFKTPNPSSCLSNISWINKRRELDTDAHEHFFTKMQVITPHVPLVFFPPFLTSGKFSCIIFLICFLLSISETLSARLDGTLVGSFSEVAITEENSKTKHLLL